MRLTAVLAKWPKKMPKGNVWTGTNRMHPRLLGPNQARLMKKVEQEKKNLFYIMRPAVSFVSIVSKDGKRSKQILRISIWGFLI